MSDCAVMSAVVCSKKLADRGQPSRLTGAAMLLLDSAIVYQRVEDKLSSLEPQILQVSLRNLRIGDSLN